LACDKVLLVTEPVRVHKVPVVSRENPAHAVQIAHENGTQGMLEYKYFRPAGFAEYFFLCAHFATTQGGMRTEGIRPTSLALRH